MTKPIAHDPIYCRRRLEAEIIELFVRWYITDRLSHRDLVALLAERSRRVDETYIRVGGKWHYLYRAVDKRGKSVDFLLRPDRGIAAAQAFFRKALATSLPRWPRKITLDGHAPSHQALRLLRREDPKWKYVLVRKCPYLNNIIEQDHRAIKRRCASMLGFKSFGNAAITIAGIELAHRIHKRQFSFGPARKWRTQSLKQLWDRALVSA
jgi:transposase-like protein